MLGLSEVSNMETSELEIKCNDLAAELIRIKAEHEAAYSILEECGLHKDTIGTIANGIRMLVRQHGRKEFELNKTINEFVETAARERSNGT